ncbi:MAG: hypothetical protein ABIB47_02245 [Candidatus Woesearchaeota archaeon]
MKRGLVVLGLILVLVIPLVSAGLMGWDIFLSPGEMESVKIEKPVSKLNIGEDLNDVWTGSIDDDNLPNFLKDGSIYVGTETYDYEQSIYLGKLQLQNFSDYDYNNGDYTVGLRISPGTYILNYSIDFIRDIPFEDLIGGQINFLGKSYTITSADLNANRIFLDGEESNFLVLTSGKNINYSGGYVSWVKVYLEQWSGKLDRIRVTWTADDELFVTEENSVSLPVFESLRFRFDGLSFYDDPYDEVYDEVYGNLYLDAFYEEDTLIQITTLVCIDSDDGLDYDEKGTASVTKEGTISKVSHEDGCLDDLTDIEKDLLVALGVITESEKNNDDLLLESECLDISEEDLKVSVSDFDITKLVTKYECLDGCKNGACVKEGDTSDEDDDGEDNEEENDDVQEENEQEESITNCQSITSPNCPRGSNVESDEDSSGCVTRYRCAKKLSNGRNAEIKVMPETASEKARERLGELDFEVELKEIGKGDGTKAVYEFKAKKQGRFLGLFKIKGDVIANVDSETGEIVSTKKPWWAFLAGGI